MNPALKAYREAVTANYCRTDQLRRTYPEISDGDFSAAYMSRALDGIDAACAAVVAAFGERELAPLRSRAEIEATEGQAIRVSRGPRPQVASRSLALGRRGTSETVVGRARCS
jgi:hypothetical protein